MPLRQPSDSTIKQWDRVQSLAAPSHMPTDTGTVFAVLRGNRVAVSWDRGGQTHPHVSELKKVG